MTSSLIEVDCDLMTATNYVQRKAQTMAATKHPRGARSPSKALAVAVERAMKENGSEAGAAAALGVGKNTLSRILAGLPCRSTSLEVVGRRLGLDAKASGAVE
jgi:hypothetical protein